VRRTIVLPTIKATAMAKIRKGFPGIPVWASCPPDVAPGRAAVGDATPGGDDPPAGEVVVGATVLEDPPAEGAVVDEPPAEGTVVDDDPPEVGTVELAGTVLAVTEAAHCRSTNVCG
jgi:hypothetical protein